ncbi:MAG TPA: hypothetical protein VNG31_01095 [Candidatus Baltobacteraceae bacterium]|nr:hypothetical protein [Candidatus Baltobacteraceae bacterium]
MNSKIRAAFAALALVLAACQGGFDSGAGGMGGMGGDMGPPVGNPGPIGAPGEMQGPTTGPNGQPELSVPGSTLAPNEAQYPVADGPNGMKCPQVSLQMQQFNCSVSFNLPPPSPSPSPSGSPNPKSKPTPTPTPSPTPSPRASASGDTSPTPSPTPPGTITLQMEPMPKDVPPMTHPDPRALRIAPLVAIRLQSDENFSLDGYASVQYTLPRQQVAGRGFAIQLYDEGNLRGRRTDQFLATYNTYNAQEQTITFVFPTPKVTVKRGQIWLLALYGLQYPPNTTPAPSVSPSPSPSPSASASAQLFAPPSASPTTSASP